MNPLAAIRRPPRQMWSRERIARFWGRPVDQCWSCRQPCERPERAHLIDRVFGGLDGPQNLVLMCPSCHKLMPSYEPGQEQEAEDYAFTNGAAWKLLDIIEEARQAEIARTGRDPLGHLQPIPPVAVQAPITGDGAA